VKQAAVHRFDSWAGWDLGERMGLVWPARQDYLGYSTLKSRVKNALYKRIIVYPAAVMDDGSNEAFLRALGKRRPAMVVAFTSPICELARYMGRRGIEGISVKGVVCTGEPLYQHQRKLVEEAFGCRVFDSYRSREAGPMAQECSAHEGMHINAECLYVETVPREWHADAGAVLVTDLMNYGMPLIRYDMGDLGVMSGRACPCGRGLPLLENIVGRSADTFVTPQGRLISTHALIVYLVDEAPGLMGQMQVVQDAPESLTLRLTKDPMPSEKLMEHQKRMIEMLFGPGMRITYEFVDRIPREKSGKYLFAKRLPFGPGDGSGRGGDR
jgi:phenylacetate-CoA ligase